jgi:hypothetical protein
MMMTSQPMKRKKMNTLKRERKRMVPHELVDAPEDDEPLQKKALVHHLPLIKRKNQPFPLMLLPNRTLQPPPPRNAKEDVHQRLILLRKRGSDLSYAPYEKLKIKMRGNYSLNSKGYPTRNSIRITTRRLNDRSHSIISR